MPIGEESNEVAKKSTLLDWLEKLIKLVTVSLGLVAAIGLPAVAFNLNRFGVPVSAATYQDVFRAGILPVVVLAVIAIYCIAAAKTLMGRGWWGLFTLHSLLLLPVAVLAYLIILAGALAYALILGFAALWPFRSLLEVLTAVDMSNRHLLFVSGALWLTIASLLFARRHRRLQRRGLAPSLGVSPAARSSDSPDETDEKDTAVPKKTLGWALASSIGFLLMFLLMMYCIKWLLDIWEPGLGEALRHAHVILVGCGLGVVAATLFVASEIPEVSRFFNRRAGAKYKHGIFVAGALVYVAFEIFYATSAYPRLYSGMGGGRPQATTLWLEQKDEAQDILALLGDAKITNAGSLKRVDGVFVLLNREDGILLTDTAVGPGRAVLVSKSRLMAVSWCPSKTSPTSSP